MTVLNLVRRPEPERSDARRRQIRLRARKLLSSRGMTAVSDPMIEAIAEVVTLECEELRARAAHIVDAVVEAGIAVGPDELEKLAYVLEFHRVAPDGTVQVDAP